MSEQPLGKDTIRLVERQEGGRKQKKKKKKKRREEGLPVYRYRDSDLLSCIPLLGATCAASRTRNTPGIEE